MEKKLTKKEREYEVKYLKNFIHVLTTSAESWSAERYREECEQYNHLGKIDKALEQVTELLSKNKN